MENCVDEDLLRASSLLHRYFEGLDEKTSERASVSVTLPSGLFDGLFLDRGNGDFEE